MGIDENSTLLTSRSELLYSVNNGGEGQKIDSEDLEEGGVARMRTAVQWQ